MAGGHGTKEIASRYPNVSGTTAGTTTQKGHTMNLMYANSLIPSREKEGLD